MWLWIKWHCKLLHGCMGLAVSRGTSHVTAKHHCKHFNGCYKNALFKATGTHSMLYIRLERSGFVRNQRTALYSWHSEALRTYLEIRRSTRGHIKEDFKKITIHTDTQMITKAALRCCALCIYVWTIFRDDKLLAYQRAASRIGDKSSEDGVWLPVMRGNKSNSHILNPLWAGMA